MSKFPKYVWMVGAGSKKIKVALRNTGGNKYFRDAGIWDCTCKVMDGELVSVSSMDSLNGNKLIECSEEEWRNDNKGYV